MTKGKYNRYGENIMAEEKQTLNLIEATKFLGTSPKTLATAVAEGKIPCKRLGKRYFFLVDALRAWLMEQ